MGRWYLAQLAGGASLEDVALIDLQVSQGEITGLKAEAREVQKEIEELVGGSPF